MWQSWKDEKHANKIWEKEGANMVLEGSSSHTWDNSSNDGWGSSNNDWKGSNASSDWHGTGTDKDNFFEEGVGKKDGWSCEPPPPPPPASGGKGGKHR
eukprot:11837078-Karenia_brevis.AAC.1